MPLFLEAALFLTASKNWSLEVALFPAAFKNRFLAASKNRSCIVNSNFSNDLEWRNNKNKSCRSQKVMQHVVDNFFIWNHLCMKNYVWISHIWSSNFLNDLGLRNDQIERSRSRNFIVDNFFTLNYLCKKNYVWISSHLKFNFLKWSWIEKWPKQKLYISKKYETL